MTNVSRFFLASVALAVTFIALPAVAEMNQSPANSAESRDSGADPQAAQGEGIVKAINPGKQQVTLSHGPIEALGWPAMTMPFKVTDAKLLEGIRVGDGVRFELGGPDNAITRIVPKE